MKLSVKAFAVPKVGLFHSGDQSQVCILNEHFNLNQVYFHFL